MPVMTMPPIAPVAFNGAFVFVWISIFLLIGMVLRSKISLFRRYLVPSCVIGGAIGFILQSLGVLDMTGFPLETKTTQLIIFHVFNMTWVFIGLKKPAAKSTSSELSLKYIVWLACLMYVGIFFIRGSGMLATTILANMGLNDGPPTLGALIGQGFLAGPGSALTIANIWNNATSFVGMPDVALAGGAMGFAISITLGIPLMNIVARKKKIDIVTCPSEDEQCGFYNECVDTSDAGKQTTVSTSIDVLAWHVAFGFLAYALTFAVSAILFVILPAKAKIFVWSLFFVFCSITAILLRKFLVKINKDHLLCNGITTRLSNSLVDFLICGTFISIAVGNVALYLVPFLVSSVVCTIAAATTVWFLTRKLKNDGAQIFAYLYGTLTGTASTGLALLRMIDPENKSNVPIAIAVGTALFTPVGSFLSPLMLHMDPVYGTNPWIPIAFCFGCAVVVIIAERILRGETNKIAWQPDD